MNLTFQSFRKIMKEQIFETFGPENFPSPRLELIWKAVSDLPERNFMVIVRHFVGNQPIKYPPNVSDFIEAAHEQRKSLAAKDTRQAANTLQTAGARDNAALKKYLDQVGADSLLDAIFKSKSGNVG